MPHTIAMRITPMGSGGPALNELAHELLLMREPAHPATHEPRVPLRQAARITHAQVCDTPHPAVRHNQCTHELVWVSVPAITGSQRRASYM